MSTPETQAGVSAGTPVGENDLEEGRRLQRERLEAFDKIRDATPAQIVKIRPEPNAALLGLLVREASGSMRTSRMIDWSTELVQLKPGDTAVIVVLAEGTDDLEQFEYWERQALRNGKLATRAPDHIVEAAEALKRADAGEVQELESQPGAVAGAGDGGAGSAAGATAGGPVESPLQPQAADPAPENISGPGDGSSAASAPVT